MNHFMGLRSLLLFMFTAGLACAAAIDGTWVAEMKVRGNKKNGGQEQLVQVRLSLKADGDKPTGTMTSNAGKRAVQARIVDGKLDGNNFSFTTVQTTKKGEQRLEWRGTIDGNTMQGTRSRDGAKRGQAFTAKRA